MRFSRDKTAADAEARENFQPRLWAIVIALIAMVGYVVAFVAENNSRVTIDFVFVTTHTSVIWLILLSLVIGIVGGLLLSQLYRRHRDKT